MEDLKKKMQQSSLLLTKKNKPLLIFHKILFDMYKNGNPKIVNLLNDSEELNSKFATRKWYIINDQNNGQYVRGNESENDSTIKFETKVITLMHIFL